MGSTRIFSLLNIIFHSNIFSQSKRWEQEWKCSTCNFVAFGRNPIQPDQVMSHVALSARIQSAKAASKCASNRAHLRYNDVSEKNYMITPPLSLPPSLSLSSFLPSFLFKVLEVVVDGAVLLMESLEVFSCLFCFALSVFFRVIGDDDRGEGWIWDLRLDAESKIDRNFFFLYFFEERNIISKRGCV